MREIYSQPLSSNYTKILPIELNDAGSEYYTRWLFSTIAVVPLVIYHSKCQYNYAIQTVLEQHFY